MAQEFIYRCISTDSTNIHTLKQQETACRNYCQANSLTVVEVLREAQDGEPGTPPVEHREEK